MVGKVPLQQTTHKGGIATAGFSLLTNTLLRWFQISRILRAIFRRPLNLQHPPSALFIERDHDPPLFGLRSELAVGERECSLPLHDADRPNTLKLVRSIIVDEHRHPIIMS